MYNVSIRYYCQEVSFSLHYFSDAPKTVKVSGSTAVKHDEENVVYTCSSSASFPEASIVWNKLVNGNLEKIDEKDTEVETIHTRSGVLKTSKFMLHPARSQDGSFLLFCIVKIQDLKFEKSSEVLNVIIARKFRY